MSGDLQQTGNILSDTPYGKFTEYLPESIKFRPTRRALSARRTIVKLRSEQQTYASNNNQLIRIFLPNNAIYDTRKGMLTFTVTLSGTGGTYIRTQSGIDTIFNRVRVLVGSTEIEDLRDYNRISAALTEMCVPREVIGSTGVPAQGFGPQVLRNTLGANPAGTQYACTLYSGVFNTELLPFDNFNGQVVLELYIDQGVNVLETDMTNPIITVSNILFHVERLDLDSSYRAFIKNYVVTHGLNIGFHTWERYINALTTGSSQNLMINVRRSSVNCLLNFLVNSAAIADPTQNDRFITWPKTITSTLTSTSLLINGTQFPDEPIDLLNAFSYEAYRNYCVWIQKWMLNGFMQIAPPITNQAFGSDRFVQIDDFEAYPDEDDLVNSFNTLMNNASLLKRLTFSGTTTANYQLDTWVEYFQQININRNGIALVTM